MIAERLNKMKTEGNYSWQELSDLTGIPVATIRKTISGETVNPSFEVVEKLLSAMGDVSAQEEFIPPDPKQSEEEMQEMMKQMSILYEARIADLWRMIDKLSTERRILFVTMLTVMGLLVTFIVYLFVDGMHGNWGIFQY